MKKYDLDERATRILSPKDNLSQVDPARATRMEPVSRCPDCGYYLLSEYTSCPYCGAQITSTDRAAKENVTPTPSSTVAMSTFINCPNCQREIGVDEALCPYCGESVALKTVRVRHRNKPTGMRCSLSIIPEEGEAIDAFKRDYQGDVVSLNRQNTEPGNMTITSKVQAVLSCENGHWFIEDKSDHGSTFIRVGHKMELSPGDTIMLGDRCFRFDTQDNS